MMQNDACVMIRYDSAPVTIQNQSCTAFSDLGNEAINEMLTREEIFSDPARLMELNQEKSQIQKSLEELYARWEILAEEEESE